MVATAPSAFAFLGGFEFDDGYRDFLGRVENYNAGQYGANVDPSASYTTIPTNSGAWQKIQGGEYATAHFGRDRLQPGGSHNAGPMAMVITTNDAGWNGPAQIFDYKVDSYDMGGTNPSSATSATLSYWVCPSILFGANNMTSPIYGNSVMLRDSTGQVIVEIGNRIQNDTYGTHTIAYKINGVWTDTAIAAATNYYQQFEVSVDYANDTVSLDLIDGGYTKTPLNGGSSSYVGTGTRTTLINNVSLNTGIDYLDTLRFTSAPGVGNNKQWQLDDFSFAATPVPEPSSLSLLGLAISGLCFRRKK